MGHTDTHTHTQRDRQTDTENLSEYYTLQKFCKVIKLYDFTFSEKVSFRGFSLTFTYSMNAILVKAQNKIFYAVKGTT